MKPEMAIETIWDISPLGLKVPVFLIHRLRYPSSEYLSFHAHHGTPPGWSETGPRAAWVLGYYNDAGYKFNASDTVGLWARLEISSREYHRGDGVVEEHFWLCLHTPRQSGLPRHDRRACWRVTWEGHETIFNGLRTQTDLARLTQALVKVGVPKFQIEPINPT